MTGAPAAEEERFSLVAGAAATRPAEARPRGRPRLPRDLSGDLQWLGLRAELRGRILDAEGSGPPAAWSRRRLANEHNVAFHRKWIEQGRSGEELIGSPDLSSVSSLNSTLSAVRNQRFFPVDGVAVFQLVVAVALPLLAVVATQVPVGDVVQWIVGKIF